MKISANFLLILILISSSLLAHIPEDVLSNIEYSSDAIKHLMELNYTAEQRELVVERFVDALMKKYAKHKNMDRLEITNKVKSYLVNAINHMPSKESSYDQLAALVKDVQNSNDQESKRFDLSYEGSRIPLNIKKKNDSESSITIEGIIKDNEITGALSFDCLRLILVVDSKDITLDYVDSLDVACPIPDEKEAKFLLGLGENLAKNLGFTRMTLIDAAEIRCEDTNEKVDLSLLKSLRDGNTYYGSRGFLPLKRDLKAALELQSYPLITVLLETNEIESSSANFKQSKNLFDEMFGKYANVHSKGNASVGAFFSWLWKENCEIAIKLIRFIFKDAATSNLTIRKIKLPVEYYKIL